MDNSNEDKMHTIWRQNGDNIDGRTSEVEDDYFSLNKCMRDESEIWTQGELKLN